MTSRSGLLACSNEVLTMIFNDPSLSKKDIKSLRLTSKELHPAATREFAMRYLAEPYVVLTRDSLRALVNICRHPLFSPHIRSIGFLTTTLREEGLKDRAGLLTSRIMWIHRNGGLARSLASIHEYADLWDEQTQLLESGGGRKLLVKAFSALGRPFAIKVTNSPATVDLTQVLSLSKMMYSYDSGKRVYMSGDADYQIASLFKLIQKAITEVGSGTLLNSLKVRWTRSVCNEMLEILGPYTGMRKLRFDIDASTLRDQGTIFVFEEMLRAAPNLERLAFGAGHVYNPVPSSTLELTTRFFDALNRCRLQALSLQDVACSLESLQRLMKKHKQTLNSIKFTRVTLLGSWRDCLSWIRKELEPISFHINSVRALDRSRINGKGAFRPKVLQLATTSLKGKENTRIGLDILVQTLA